MPLDKAVLVLLRLNIKHIATFDWITPPDPEMISRAIQDLSDW